MQNENLFYETQKRPWWFVIPLLAVINVILLVAIYQQVIEIQLHGKQSDIISLIFTGICITFVNFLLLKLQLITIIRNEGVYVRLYPIHFKFKFLAFNSMTKCFIRKRTLFSGFMNNGLSGFGRKRIFTMLGNMGLNIELSSGKKFIIGTQRDEEMRCVLEKLGKIKP